MASDNRRGSAGKGGNRLGQTGHGSGRGASGAHDPAHGANEGKARDETRGSSGDATPPQPHRGESAHRK
jgi:hypothetical protein